MGVDYGRIVLTTTSKSPWLHWWPQMRPGCPGSRSLRLLPVCGAPFSSIDNTRVRGHLAVLHLQAPSSIPKEGQGLVRLPPLALLSMSFLSELGHLLSKIWIAIRLMFFPRVIKG